jgi:hypothetical protein
MFLFNEPTLNEVQGPRSEMLANIQARHVTPQARLSATRENYSALMVQALAKDAAAGHREVFASNTYSGTLVTSYLMDGSISDLQNVWAMLNAYSLASFCDPFKPLATGEMKHVTGSEPVQSGTSAPATFEPATGSTIGPISLTMNWINQPMRVGPGDLNNGLRIDDLRVKALASFSDQLTQLATAPITAADFTATPLIQTPAAFGLSDSATLQAQLQKANKKNLILAGPYMARIANQPGFFQKTGQGLQDSGGYKPFGWDGIYLASNWTSAGNNIQGFACHPQAIVRATGLPLNPPTNTMTSVSFTLPGCDVAIQMNSWFSLATRTFFVSWDVIAGFAAADLTAGIVIASGTPS